MSIPLVVFGAGRTTDPGCREQSSVISQVGRLHRDQPEPAGDRRGEDPRDQGFADRSVGEEDLHG